MQSGTPPPAVKAEVRIVVADDHELVRSGIALTIQRRSGWAVVGMAASGAQAIDLCRETRPDVLILDFHMPDGNGLEALRAMSSISPGTRVLVLSMDSSDALIDEMLLAGAHGYVLKSDAARELIQAVETVASGKPFFTARVSERLLESLRKGPSRPVADASVLTPREREIVSLIAEGKTNKEIAPALGISVRTVETHRANIMEKLGVHDVGALVLYAVKVGLCDPGAGPQPTAIPLSVRRPRV